MTSPQVGGPATLPAPNRGALPGVFPLPQEGHDLVEELRPVEQFGIVAVDARDKHVNHAAEPWRTPADPHADRSWH